MTTLTAHLKKRHLYHKDIITSGDTTYFLLWNISGQLTGYQQYKYLAPKKGKNPKELKYFTRGKGVWGLQYLNTKLSTMYVVEGVFDAVRLHNLGLNCIAVLGNSPKPLKTWLNTLSYKTIAVCDGDRAGRALSKCADTSICLPEGEDLGSLDKETIKKLLDL
jgi:DNA primase